eukprot:37154-Rhodomonas_salina.1
MLSPLPITHASRSRRQARNRPEVQVGVHHDRAPLLSSYLFNDQVPSTTLLRRTPPRPPRARLTPRHGPGTSQGQTRSPDLLRSTY